MIRFIGRLLSVACFVSLLFSCSENNSNAPSNTINKSSVVASSPSIEKKYQVAETFNVGNNVVVRSLAIDDRTSSLWIGTSVGALDIDLATGTMRQTYTRENGLANEYIFSVFVDSLGAKWLGTNGGGVSHRKENKWTTYFPMHGLADYWVYSFAESTDSMWVGTWAGISRIDRKTGKFTNYLKELVNEWVYGLAVDRKNQLWVGTEGGVNMFDGTHWHTWTHDKDGLGAPNNKDLPFSKNTGLGTRDRHNLSVLFQGGETFNPNYVFCLTITSDDHVWAGTWGGGVSVYDGQQWKNYTVADGLAANIVYSVASGPDGAIWFGTSNGLSRFKDDQWQTYNKHDGLLDNHVYAVQVSVDGNVWVGTRHGVARLSIG